MFARTTLANSPNGWSSSELMPLRTDPQGRFELRGVYQDAAWRLHVVTDHQGAAAEGILLQPLAWIAAGHTGKTDDLDLGDLRLDQGAVLQLDVRGFDGAPASAARIVMTENRQQGRFLHNTVDALTDRLGRFAMIVPETDLFLGIAAGAAGFSMQEFKPKPGMPAAQRIRLAVPITVSGRVLDRNGKGIANASLSLNPRHHQSYSQLMILRQASGSIKSGPDGRFVVTVPVANTQYSLSAYVRLDNQTFHSGNQEFFVDEDGLPDLEVSINVEVPVGASGK
jgi:hypothetical protein